MVWDKTKPLGTEVLRYGDDRIRELKSDLEQALQVEHYFPVNNTEVKLIPKIFANTYPPTSYTGRLYFDTNSYRQTFAIFNGTNWEYIGNNFNTIPSETCYVTNTTGNFLQTLTLGNTFALRITNNWSITNNSGGSNSPTDFNHNHNILATNIPHSHSFTVTSPNASNPGYDTLGYEKGYFAGIAHTHNANIVLQTADFSHYHYISNLSISINYYMFRIVKVVY